VAQAVGIVGIFVAGDDLVDALSQQFERVVTDALVLPRIAEQRGQIAGQMMALVEGETLDCTPDCMILSWRPVTKLNRRACRSFPLSGLRCPSVSSSTIHSCGPNAPRKATRVPIIGALTPPFYRSV
jgi:hypothetical protein